jgi:hypothetical protein
MDSEPDFPQDVREKTKRETRAPNLRQIPASMSMIPKSGSWFPERIMLSR